MSSSTLTFVKDMAKFIACFALVIGAAMGYLTIGVVFGMLWGPGAALAWVVGSMVIGAAALVAAFEKEKREHAKRETKETSLAA